MQVKQINSLTEVNAISWNNLVKNNDLFVRHEFLLALEQSGSISAEKGWQSKHLLVFKQQELIAVMPLYLKNHSRGEYVFDQQWADAYYQSGMEYYPKWLNAIPFTPCQGQRILIQDGQDISAIMQLCIDTLYSDLSLSLSAGKKARVCEACACALVLSGRRAKKPIHDGSQKNELNGYIVFIKPLELHANPNQHVLWQLFGLGMIRKEAMQTGNIALL
jgi:hypothetical protein